MCEKCNQLVCKCKDDTIIQSPISYYKDGKSCCIAVIGDVHYIIGSFLYKDKSINIVCEMPKNAYSIHSDRDEILRGYETYISNSLYGILVHNGDRVALYDDVSGKYAILLEFDSKGEIVHCQIINTDNASVEVLAFLR